MFFFFFGLFCFVLLFLFCFVFVFVCLFVGMFVCLFVLLGVQYPLNIIKSLRNCFPRQFWENVKIMRHEFFIFVYFLIYLLI